jgi:hypothetical protein
MKVEVELKTETDTMNQATARTISQIDVISPTTSADISTRASDNRRYQFALGLSLVILIGVMIYGSFATLF